MNKRGLLDDNDLKRIRKLLIDHYASKPPCCWGVVIKFSKDFGKTPLSALEFYHDEPVNIRPIVRLLRKNGTPVLNIKHKDERTHIITLLNHSTEN